MKKKISSITVFRKNIFSDNPENVYEGEEIIYSKTFYNENEQVIREEKYMPDESVEHIYDFKYNPVLNGEYSGVIYPWMILCAMMMFQPSPSKPAFFAASQRKKNSGLFVQNAARILIFIVGFQVLMPFRPPKTPRMKM